ncbi:NRPS [Pyricularia oryzae]|nr:NRPS [Pyricularia oryzae]
MSIINHTDSAKPRLSEAEADDWRRVFQEAPPCVFPQPRAGAPSASTPSASTVQSGSVLRRQIFLPNSGRSGFPLDTVLQAAWAFLNASYSDTEDVVFGMALVDEDTDDGEPRTALPFRFTLHPDQTIADCLEAVEAQEFPLLSSSGIDLEAIAGLGPELRGATQFRNQLVVYPAIMANTDILLDRPLNVECFLNPSGVLVQAFYDPEMLEGVEVRQILATFEFLIQQFDDVSNLDRIISQVEIISPQDKGQLQKWGEPLPPAVEKCVHWLFQEKARETPRAEAVFSIAEKVSWTYEQLDTLTDKLAHLLVSKRVSPGKIVPLMFEKSVWTVVAAIAVLKAGGAFGYIEPNQPWEDVSRLLGACESTFVLCSAKYEGLLSTHGVESVIIDEALLSRLPSCGSVEDISQPADISYIIFTSGTTGRSKGIVSNHSSFCTSILAHGKAEFYGPESRCFAFSAYNFDVSVTDIFTTLAFGACICIPSDEEKMNALAATAARMRVTHITATPTVSQFINPGDVPTVKTFITGGEFASPEIIKKWVSAGRNYINIYGPAECNSRITHHSFKVGDSGSCIGRPSGCVVWITKSNDPNALVPLGAPGELLIEGHLVSNGYLKEEDKTAEAFIAAPDWLVRMFPDRASSRLYRTGDLAQWLPNGNLRLLGRRDTQMKIHGVRLEAAHIEFKLSAALPSGSQAVVEKITVGQESKGGQESKREKLAAFVTLPGPPTDDDTPSFLEPRPDLCDLFAGVQETMLANLPAWMCPNYILPLDKFPHGQSGKVNRKVLRDMVADWSEESLNRFTVSFPAGNKEVPIGAMEKAIAGLWAEVLHLPASLIGRQDTFFRLGGDSVAAMKVAAVCNNRQNGLIISVADIFRHPKLSDLAANISNAVAVSETTIAPFELIGGPPYLDQYTQALNQAGIDPSTVQDIFPCTPMQEGMMAETMLSPNTYKLQHVLRLDPLIDLPRLQGALDRLVQSFAILRTRIILMPRIKGVTGSSSYQVVVKGLEEYSPVQVKTVDKLKSALSVEKKAVKVGYGSELSRFALVIAEGGKYLVWTIHHAVTDGYTYNLILEKLQEMYNGTEPSTITPTPFAHFVKYLQDQDPERSAQIWRQMLDGGSSFQWPSCSDKAHEPIVTRTITKTFSLPANESGCTISTVIRAAWALVLSGLVQSPDVIMGLTLAGRDIELPGIDNCAGPCLSTVPFRVLVKNETCAEMLRAVQQLYADIIPHQHFGIKNIRRVLSVSSEACNISNLLVIQPGYRVDQGLWTQEDDLSTDEELNFGFTLECILDSESKMTVLCGFDEIMVSETKAREILDMLSTAIDFLTPVSNQGKLLTEMEGLHFVQRTKIPKLNIGMDAVEQCLHSLVEEQARSRPNAIMIDAWDAKLTYREADEYATRLASFIAGFGVGPEVIVPFAFEKSAWTTVAILAILKAGGACVALDMNYPRSRLERIMQDVEAKTVLCSRKNEQALKTYKGLHSIVVDRDSLDCLPSEAFRSDVKPTNAAWVVYSSGSTGTPKGAVLEHRSLATTARTNSEVLGCGPDTRALSFASHSFDVVIEDNIIIPIFGGCICIPSDEDRFNDLAGVMTRMSVNWADLTPTVARMLSPSTVPTLRTMVLGGEALTQDIIDTWTPVDGFKLYNTYGPSECSVQSTCCLEPLGRDARGGNIGHPMNCNIFVVDSENPNVLLPGGEAGEMLIEGPIVGRGYLKNEDKTREAFVRGLVWAKDPARRFYRTGDLGVFNDDGSLSFISRRDTQIKLNGQRVELGEIEAVLLKTSNLAQVCVEAFSPQSSSSRKLLAAFVQLERRPSDEKNAKANSAVEFVNITSSTREKLVSIKQNAANHLPEYMVPSLFVPVYSLPINASGKIERKVLRELASGFSQQQTVTYALRADAAVVDGPVAESAIAEVLMELWAEVLQIDLLSHAIGSDDSFLEMGGDSIAAMQLVSRAKMAGLELSVRGIMKTPTFANMVLSAKVIPGVELRPKRISTAKASKFGLSLSIPTPTSAVSRSLPTPSLAKDEPYSAFSLVPETLSRTTLLNEVLDSVLGEERRLVNDVYPCTPLQDSLMALTAKDSTAYVLREVFDLPEYTDINRFKQAWEDMVAANDIFSTRIVHVAGHGSFSVVLDTPLEWTEVETLDEYLALDTAKEKHMNYGTRLVRFGLVSNHGSPQFVWTIHHALYDGFSYGLTLEAVDQAYQGMGLPPTRPILDLVRYLGQLPQDGVADFWTGNLEACQAIPFPPVAPGQICIADNTVKHSVKFRRPPRSKFTAATVLKAAWSILMARVSESTDVVYGLTSFGRDVPIDDVDIINGPLLTTTPVRMQVDLDATVESFLGQINSQSIEAGPFSHAGIHNIKKLNNSCRSACEFQNLLVIQPASGNADEDSLFCDRATHTTANIISGFGLVVECGLGEETVALTAHHDSSVLSALRAERLLRQFARIIEQLIRLPRSTAGITVSEIDILSSKDRQDLREWNKNCPAWMDACMHQLIKRHTLSKPEFPAIESRQVTLSYQQLDDLATHVAHQLCELGAAPERIIPISMEKSVNGIVAMLAVLKAGAAFVPINPEDPQDRRADLLAQVQAEIILVSPNTKDRYAAFNKLKVVVLPPLNVAEWGPLNTSPLPSPSNQVKPSNLAYVLFTSGSTGRPKGVMTEHRSVCASTAGHGAAMGFGDFPRRVLQFATYTFDACIGEIFTTLSHGGTICVPTEQERMDDLSGFIRDFRCDWAFFTPTFARLLKPENIPSIKTLVLGGEAVTAESVDTWAGKLRLMNGYGPTETCVFCTTRDISKGDKAEKIGHMVSSVGWVVDPQDHNRLVPIGCTGELLVQGPGLSRGYLGQPDKTREVFVPAPAWLRDFGYSTDQVLYKTGDLVRQDLTDGSLLYLGRKDNQTKINGQRLEIGEIEAVLNGKDAEIEQVVVVAGKTTIDKNKQVLVAFVEFVSKSSDNDMLLKFDDESRLKMKELETLARASLPKYMVPTLWIPVSQMPSLATSSKTDRKTLAFKIANLTPEQLTAYSLSTHANVSSRAPSTNMEISILTLVAQSLGRDVASIGMDDNFLALGGDSITAIQLTAAARAAGILLTHEDVFRHPCLADMAMVAKFTDASAANAHDVTDRPFSLIPEDKRETLFSALETTYRIPRSTIADVLPCAPLQPGLIALTAKDSQAYVLREVYRLPAKLDVARFKQSWEAVARDAGILRTTIVNIDELNSFYQVVRGIGNKVIEWRTGKSVKGYFDEDKRLPFQLGTPFSRLAIVDTPFTGSYFIWSIHHSIYDGWSKNLILRRVQAAYESSSPQPVIKPTPPFSRFIAHLQQTDPEECKAFWQNQFKGISAPAWPPLPNQQFNPLLDGEVAITLPFERPAGLRFTTSTIIKAAWALVQGCHSGSPDDVLFGVIQSGRDTPVQGITEMVGPCITTVPLRIALDRTSTTVPQFLQMIQDQTTDMIKFEHAGLQNIQRMGRECRDACGFACVMVIQPPDLHDEASFLGAQKLSDEEKETLRFGMGIQIRIRRDNQLDVLGNFDHRITPEAVMRRILYQFKHVVEQIMEHAGESTMPVSDVDLFSPYDRDQVIAWNQPTELTPVDLEGHLAGGLTHELFHRTATVNEAREKSMAVNAWDVDFRYGDLDRITTKLAHHLRNTFNIGPEVIVPLCFEKSGWAIVALLSVIKAGGAVVFLDPSYPMARLNEILSQIEAKVILCSLAQVSLWRSSGLSVQVVDNVSIAALPDAGPELPITNATMSSSLYVIFTSGSTGVPKGCVIEHRAFLYSCQAQARIFGMRPDHRVLQGCPYSFDVSVMEILTTLLHGACVCVPNERAKNRSMVEVINDFHINWTFLTPSVVKFIDPAEVPTLETLILGGEAMTRQSIDIWAGKVRLINGYGPTECAISAAVNNNITLETDPANIGKAVGGMCWIVEAENHDRLAPVGTVGELIIEGPTLGRGYLKNPEKTAEAFINDPAWSLKLDGKHRRLYKSGDLAYYDADGCIIFCGRKDAQVKVRGQRMELGEIESHLSQNPEIQHAAVFYPASGPCKGQLVGLVSLKKVGAETNRDGIVELVDGQETSIAAAITSDATIQLSSLVPGYMIPNLWIPVKSFPLLPSEKLNRKCLAQWLNGMSDELHKRVCGISTANPDGSSVSPLAQVVEPSTEAEKTIHQVWCDVLNLQAKEVGVTQDFVTLGGDSILAMAMASKLRKAGFQVSMTDLLMTRTIAKLAARIGHTAKSPKDKSMRPLGLRLVSPATESDLDNENDTGYESDNSDATTAATSISVASRGRAKAAHPATSQQPTELFDLTPMQQYYASLALGNDELSRQTDARFNHSFCIKLKRPINPAILSSAYSQLISRHMMLRVRLQRCGTEQAACGFRQFVSPDVKRSFRLREWSNVASVDDVKDRLEDARITLDLENGPISSLDLVSTTAGDSFLYIVAHHLVVDLVSWNSILRDFDDLLSKGAFSHEEPGPFPLWAQKQAEYARLHLDPKTTLPAPIPAADFAFWGMADADGNLVPNLARDTIHHTICIPEAATAMLLKESHAKHEAEPMDVLVSALTRSFFLVYGQTRESPPAIFRFGHGREDIEGLPDVSSTVGWFSTLSPLHVPVGLGGDCSAAGVLGRTVELRRRTPHNGWAYFAARYHHPDGGAVFGGHERMEVAVNYLGVRDRQVRGADSAVFDLSRMVDGGLGAGGQDVKCMSLFGVTAEVRAGCLEVDLEWNRRVRGQGQVRAWWREFEACLKELASAGSPYVRSGSGEWGVVPSVGRRESLSREQRRMRSLSRQRSRQSSNV